MGNLLSFINVLHGTYCIIVLMSLISLEGHYILLFVTIYFKNKY